nr:T cell receptor gamma chain V-J-C1 [Paralichthys olivaceus]
MLLLPAAALCCLCSALVTMAAELKQNQLSLTSSVGGTASFSCGGTDQCGSYVFWYQKKDTGTFRIILRVEKSDGSIESGYSHPQKDDFTAERKPNNCKLKIKKVKSVHSASYYCVCWKSTERIFIFGSGTKLFVTDTQVKPVKPMVRMYRTASRDDLDGKSVLLCVASNMSPPLVHFSWKRQKEGGPLEDLTSAQGEQLELRVPERTAAIMVVDRDASYTYKYRCNVRHEGGPTERVVPALPAPTPPPSTPPPSTPPPSETSPEPTWSQHELKLLCLLYTVLMVKSLVYCCGLSLINILRNRERPPAAHKRTELPPAASTSH